MSTTCWGESSDHHDDEADICKRQPWITIFLVLWIITNVIAGFFALPTLSEFYWWGYGWPLYHTVSVAKTIFYSTKNRIGLNFGILLCWLALNLIIFPFGVLRSITLGKKMAAEIAKRQQSEAENSTDMKIVQPEDIEKQ